MTPAKSISASVENNTMRFTVSGVSPTNSAGTPANFGQPLTAGMALTIAGWSTVKKFSWIAAVSGSDPLLNVGINF